MSRSRARARARVLSTPVDLGPQPAPTPEWSRRLLDRAPGPVPDYGTDEWQALPDSDPGKVAAVVAAAEAWRRHSDPAVVADRLRLELAAARHTAALEAEEAAKVAWRNFAEPIAARATQPSHAQLCDLRGEPERAEAARASEARRGLGVSPPLQGAAR